MHKGSKSTVAQSLASSMADYTSAHDSGLPSPGDRTSTISPASKTSPSARTSPSRNPCKTIPYPSSTDSSAPQATVSPTTRRRTKTAPSVTISGSAPSAARSTRSRRVACRASGHSNLRSQHGGIWASALRRLMVFGCVIGPGGRYICWGACRSSRAVLGIFLRRGAGRDLVGPIDIRERRSTGCYFATVGYGI